MVVKPISCIMILRLRIIGGCIQGVIELIKKFKWLVAALAVILVTLGFGLVFFLLRNSNLAARYKDTEFTVTAYNRAVLQCQAGLEFSGDKKDPDTCSAEAIENMIYLEALRQKAKEYSISVVDKVEQDYQELYKPYESEETALSLYKSDFLLDSQDIKDNLEILALEDALREKLIKSVSVTGAFASYDFFDDEEGETQAVSNATEMVNKYFKDSMQQGSSRQELVILAEKLRKENKKYDSETGSAAGIMTEQGLNESNYSEYFEEGNKLDWEKISSLEKVGDTTEVFKSPAGFVVIWRLESTSPGNYISFDDFKKEAISNSKIYSFDYIRFKTKLAL